MRAMTATTKQRVWRRAGWAVMALLLLGACGTPTERIQTAAATDAARSGGGVETAAPTNAAPAPKSTETPEPAMTDIPTDAPSGEVPDDLIADMKADLADRLGIPADRIGLLEAKAVQWRDSSLGCPEKGQMYMQVITPGYQVLLEAEGQEYDYRAAEQPEHFKLCEGEG